MDLQKALAEGIGRFVLASVVGVIGARVSLEVMPPVVAGAFGALLFYSLLTTLLKD